MFLVPKQTILVMIVRNHVTANIELFPQQSKKSDVFFFNFCSYDIWSYTPYCGAQEFLRMFLHL